MQASAHETHLAILHLLERGERERAHRLLEALAKDAPEYVPAQVELAILLRRGGRSEEATALMERVLANLADRDDGELVEAPEPLPVSYFRRSAKALIAASEGRRR